MLDLGLEGINFTKSGDLWQLTAKVRNNGNQAISEFALNAQLDGKSLINELFSGDTIFAGTFKNLTFNTRFQVNNTETPGYLCIDITEVNHGADDNTVNNHKCITTGKEFEVFDVYPNPFTDQINIGINIPEEGVASVRIVDAAGKVIMNPNEKNYLQGYNTISMTSLHMEAGVYFAEVKYNDQKKIIRILKW
jgi:hypothetical protein